MFERLVKNTEGLNSVAGHLRRTQELGELKRLAEEWLVPTEDVEDFIAGRRFRLAEIKIEEQEFATAEDKLRTEMWYLKDKDFTDILAQHLIGKCEDALFSSQVLQPHKSLQKCMDYVMEQAFHMAEEKCKAQGGGDAQNGRRQNVGMALAHQKVFGWAEAYYALDDAADEAKKKEKRKKELQEERKKEEWRKADAAKRQAGGGKKPNAGNRSKKGTPEVAEKPKDAQMSMFDLMNGSADSSKEKENEGV